MEEENLCSSLPFITDSVLQQPQQDSCTAAEHSYINGEQEAVVWGETEVQINEKHGAEQLHLSPHGGRESPEEAEQWEQIIWPVRPMTSTTAPLSFATVLWDMPGTALETPTLITDSSSANELDSGGVMSLDTTSPSLQQSQDINAELFTQEEREEQDEIESWLLLNSDLEFTGNGSEPCDAVDVQEAATQEKEEPTTHELVDDNKEIPLTTDSEEEEGHPAVSDAIETVDFFDILDDIEDSEDGADSIIDLRPEEEREESDVLLTGQTDSEEDTTSVNSVETEEQSEEGVEVEEEESVTNVSCNEEGGEENTVSCLNDVEAPVEPQQTDNTGLSINPDDFINLRSDTEQLDISDESPHSGSEEKDIEILEESHEDPAGQTEEQEMCEDVDEEVDAEQSEATQQQDDNEEPTIQEADDVEKIENSEEILELTEKQEHTGCPEQQDSDQTTPQDVESPADPERSESEQLGTIKESEQIESEEQHSGESDLPQHLEESSQMEPTELSAQPEGTDEQEDSTHLEQTVCDESKAPEVAEQQEQMELSDQNEQSLQTTDLSQPAVSEQFAETEKTDDSEVTEQLSPKSEVAQQTAETQLDQEMSHQAEEVEGTVVANGEQPKPTETVVPHMNGGDVERGMACSLAERLHKLDGIQRVDVVKHIDKDNDFSRAVGEEYLKFFDFTGKTLDHALRSFLKVVVLIGETQERERVLQHFSCRFHHCNPDTFCSSEAVLALTCALMLLNTDLHGQNVGKCMSASKFVSNLDGMNEGENFNKDLLKSLYNSIKSEPLEWAVNEEELNSVFSEDNTGDDATLRSKSNPFQDVPHDKKASLVKQGLLQRKLHADIDGKRTPWGKRGWKTFCGVLKGMVLYLQKDDYRKEQQTNEEVVSVHHSLAEPAAEYTKKPHVFRLQTADWRVFLFQAPSKVEMNSWISRINLVSALHSSPPFPAAVGSQRRFFRPILPASQSAQTLERQLQCHAGMLESFKADLSYLQDNPPEGKKAKAKELEERRVRAEYLQHEMCRYTIYIHMLEVWKDLKTEDGPLSTTDLNQFDKAVCPDSAGEDEGEEEGGLKRAYSSPSLEVEMAPATVIKVRRNISERRTYRKTIIPRFNKEA
ncbi:PH and SEC7 domain-containing protein 2 [Scomber japonicus]|uniref:PH and SEC7 domain-containing protein 2 n=1 Tax=Scomber japonicus TaxID=13676 RepID=UPI0023061B22|nr:PH and SEC7 domain-containing protein 2 [Scomber japonicus]XP_053196199.1 PH and SEC7 domain-containing protein 2 [Scomber japonicus]XP_053196200.1 PH and SEC7 domain-containing protein 2 [Scomber japonicus]XP_053196201.1 PH and SEC7 domain-containing protein 2 [Scomber japonicus]XP_053196202.1 PH and SEC7 domain-containing protein 2 [Scomber japonicus]